MPANARTSVRSAWARGLRPDPVVTVDQWAEARRRVPSETSARPGPWRNATAPYLVEPMRAMSPGDPAGEIVIMGSAQVGKSECVTNFLGLVMDLAPGPTMIVYPTVEAGKDWANEKLDPAIRATPALKAKVVDATTRDGTGSTSRRKRFPGGMLIIAGANSTRALRQRSIRNLVKEELSDWPLDVDGQGDPEGMADARQIAFLTSGRKTISVSTPRDKNVCRITRKYEASDRRRYFVPCPHCGHAQVLRFRADERGRGGFVFETTAPHRARYACEACGALIEHHQKHAMVAAGEWRATNPGPGRAVGFHIWSAYSPFVAWDDIVARFLAAKDDPQQLKVFVNTWLGEPWEDRGEAPDWQRLQKRAEDYPIGVVPPGAAFVTIGVDVQKTGVYYEAVAWGFAKTSWSIDFGFVEGDPFEDPATGRVWQALDALWAKAWPTAWGRHLQADMLAIDSGFATHQVYAWARARPRAMAVKGVPGWGHGVLGEASPQDVNLRGKKIRRGVLLHPVHVWNLSGEVYLQLRKEPPAPGSEEWPLGYCHHTAAHTEGYFQQLTAPHLAQREVRGRLRQEWVSAAANHYHDCRNYALAAWYRAARRLGVMHHDAAAWARLLEARGADRIAPQLALPLDAPAPIVAAVAAEDRPADTRPAAAPPPPHRPAWLQRRGSWLTPR